MFNAIVIFSRELTDEEVENVAGWTAAESITAMPPDIDFLSDFARIVLQREDWFDLYSYRLRQFSYSFTLFASYLRPVMLFQDQEGILETLQKYGEIAGLGEQVLRPADFITRSASSICDGKRQLGLDVNTNIDRFLSYKINQAFKAEFDSIVQAAKRYYFSVSNFDD